MKVDLITNGNFEIEIPHREDWNDPYNPEWWTIRLGVYEGAAVFGIYHAGILQDVVPPCVMIRALRIWQLWLSGITTKELEGPEFRWTLRPWTEAPPLIQTYTEGTSIKVP